MGESYAARGGGASVLALRRALAAAEGRAPGRFDTDAAPLERTDRAPATPPRCVEAPVREGSTFAARPLTGEPVVGFAAFLDGVQRSVVADYVRETIPVVHATTAAVIRVRNERTLSTWRDGPIVERAAYLPVALTGSAAADAARSAGLELVDTSEAMAGSAPGGSVREPSVAAHPHELVAIARKAVKLRREAAEERLAKEWCAAPGARPLYIDGPIRAFGDRGSRDAAVGVVKSHNTVYVGAHAIPLLARLAPGERSTALAIGNRPGVAVASWYLRLRPSDGRDPFAGLVRIEVADATFTTERADLVSRWVLAEREPAALPDARWRVMAYGIRDCEEFLRAVAAA
jgi:hypothetical protein